MAEAKTLEAGWRKPAGFCQSSPQRYGKERHSRAAAPRKRAPLGKAPGKNPVKEAEGLMSCALRLRNREPVRAARTAERAFGFYLVAAKTAFSEKNRADCFVGAGNALSLAASLCEKSDSRRAGRLRLEAGDHFHAGARHGTMPEENAIKLAREQYELALRLGGIVRVLERKIAMCDRASGF